MTTQGVTKTEWWPVFVLTGRNEVYGEDCEFSDEELARIRSAFVEFDDVQRLIRSKYTLTKQQEVEQISAVLSEMSAAIKRENEP